MNRVDDEYVKWKAWRWLVLFENNFFCSKKKTIEKFDLLVESFEKATSLRMLAI